MVAQTMTLRQAGRRSSYDDSSSSSSNDSLCSASRDIAQHHQDHLDHRRSKQEKPANASTSSSCRQLVRTATGKYDIALASNTNPTNTITRTTLHNTSPKVKNDETSEKKEHILGGGTTTKKKRSLLVDDNKTHAPNDKTPGPKTKETTAQSNDKSKQASSDSTETALRNKKVKKVRKIVIVKKRVKKSKVPSNNVKEEKADCTPDLGATTSTVPSRKISTQTKTCLAQCTKSMKNGLALLKSILKKDSDTSSGVATDAGIVSFKNNKGVSFGTTIRTEMRYLETCAEIIAHGMFNSIWYEYDEIKAFKYDAEDEATAVEHEIVSAAWRTTRRPGTNGGDSSNRNSSHSDGENDNDETAEEDPHEALRGLEGHTAEGHWRAYKARSDVVNAVMDEQEEQRRTGGWKRSIHCRPTLSTSPVIAAATTCPYRLAAASREVSRVFADEAAERGLQDAIVAKRLAKC